MTPESRKYLITLNSGFRQNDIIAYFIQVCKSQIYEYIDYIYARYQVWLKVSLSKCYGVFCSSKKLSYSLKLSIYHRAGELNVTWTRRRFAVPFC